MIISDKCTCVFIWINLDIYRPEVTHLSVYIMAFDITDFKILKIVRLTHTHSPSQLIKAN